MGPPVLKPRQVVALLEARGFVEVRQRGSHRQFRHPDGRFRTSSWAPAAPGFTIAWALPVCFGLHVFEEFGFPGGFGEWSVRHRPQTASAMTPAHFWRINVIGGLAAVGGTLAALDYAGGYSYFGVRVWLVLLCTLGVNAVSHLAGTVRSRSYSPGLITSVALYLPLLVLGASYLLARVVDPLPALLFVAVGVAAYLLLMRRLRTAVFRPTIVADGHVVGTWQPGSTARATAAADLFFEVDTAVSDALGMAVRGYDAFASGSAASA